MKLFAVLTVLALIVLAIAAPQLRALLGPSDNAVDIAQAQAAIEAARTGQIAGQGLAATALINSLTVLALVLILLVLVCAGAYLLIQRLRQTAQPRWQPGPNANFGRAPDAPRLPASRPAAAQLPPGAQPGQWVYMPAQPPAQQPQPQIIYVQAPDGQDGEVEW